MTWWKTAFFVISITGVAVFWGCILTGLAYGIVTLFKAARLVFNSFKFRDVFDHVVWGVVIVAIFAVMTFHARTLPQKRNFQ